jgi:hypothetical protein
VRQSHGVEDARESTRQVFGARRRHQDYSTLTTTTETTQSVYSEPHGGETATPLRIGTPPEISQKLLHVDDMTRAVYFYPIKHVDPLSPFVAWPVRSLRAPNTTALGVSNVCEMFPTFSLAKPL